MLKHSYQRMKNDLEYQKQGSKKGSKRQRSLNATPSAGGKTNKKSKKRDLLNMSANIRPGLASEALMLNTPSEMIGLLNNSAVLSPFALGSPMTANAESQADIIDFQEMIRLEEKVKILEQ
jgi:hypothetical protein